MRGRKLGAAEHLGAAGWGHQQQQQRLRYCWGQLHLAVLQLCQQQHWRQAALPACQRCECRLLLLLLFLVGAVLLVLLPVWLVFVVVHLTCLVQPQPPPPPQQQQQQQEPEW